MIETILNYRGLIPRGLSIECLMYSFKKAMEE